MVVCIKILKRFDILNMFISIGKIIVTGLFFSVIIPILFVLNLIPIEWTKAFGYSEDTGLYVYLLECTNKNRNIILWIILIIYAAIVIAIIINWVTQNWKEKLLLIKHSTFEPLSITYEKEQLSDYFTRSLKLDQSLITTNTTINDNKKVLAHIKSYINKLPKIEKYKRRGYRIGYVGIAHTPLIFMLGYDVGDGNKAVLFHKYRYEGNDKFQVLSDNTVPVKLTKEEEYPSNKNELSDILLCIATSFDITGDDVSEIRSENDYFLKYSTEKDFDMIYSSKQVYKYVQEIKTEIGNIEKTHKIGKIKICIASSVAFTFALGQAFSKTHDSEVVVFHYQRGNKYPWGINVTAKKAIFVKIEPKL
ncbi:MAG TPA: SAVED domain-containing protein [Clostridiales bacterium]|nr:SAVED domain-containing protein [Clostridiales bacterium]